MVVANVLAACILTIVIPIADITIVVYKYFLSYIQTCSTFSACKNRISNYKNCNVKITSASMPITNIFAAINKLLLLYIQTCFCFSALKNCKAGTTAISRSFTSHI